MLQSIRTLMAGLIDYAGLYPPAKLAMAPAAEAFAHARIGDNEWMLGRFICPASRLDEFSKAAAVLMPGTHATSGYREHADLQEPWRLSVILDGDLAAGLDALHAFNLRHEHEDAGRAVADAVELKVARPGDIDDALDRIPEEVFPFFEFPPEVVNAGDARGFIAALAGNAAAAKIRTGGITADAFPPAPKVAAFIAACHSAGIPFKATAGLHHPLRAEYPLTYEPGCARGVMHGFLNVFLAAAAVGCDHLDCARATAILEEGDASRFHFTDEGVRWREVFLDTTQLAKAREAFALSYGSCSFDEPVADLRKLGLL
ncbi:MAG: hypothetical protein WD749_14890 [Phycisphaerales bacterium]